MDGQNEIPETVSQLDYVFPCQDSIAANLPVGNFLAELWPTIIPVKTNLTLKVTNLPRAKFNEFFHNFIVGVEVDEGDGFAVKTSANIPVPIVMVEYEKFLVLQTGLFVLSHVVLLEEL
nr:MAG TPA: hypothetical protein [Caudoviricetes sp.]